MDYDRIIEITEICLPVFSVIGVGKLLDRRGMITANRRLFINRLIYNIALPALILSAVAQRRLGQFFNGSLLLPPLLSVACVVLLYTVLAGINRYKGGMAAVFVFGTFWANITYIGLPLAESAFGQEGFQLAAVYNAFIMPVFLVVGSFLIAFRHAKSSNEGRKLWKQLITNPILLAALVGIAIAALAEPLRNDAGQLQVHEFFAAFIRLVGNFLELIGKMGLPLALIVIGASMRLEKIKEHRVALLLVLVGKLLLMPLFTLLAANLLFAAPDHTAIGVAVLLGATPNAVASYVVACNAGVDEGFVSSLLVLGTGLSIITIPLWLYFIL